MAGIKDGRSNNWIFVLYPESAPDNWRDIIDDTMIEWVESPIHDKDIWPTGEPKKAHYHITLIYPSNKSYLQVSELVQEQLKQPRPEICHTVRGSIRYMVHKDHPDKAQYNWSDIKCHGGADLNDLCLPNYSERLQIQKEIIEFIDDNGIVELNQIVRFARKMDRDDWMHILTNVSTMFFTAYINSIRNMNKDISAITDSIYTKIKSEVLKEYLKESKLGAEGE